MIVPFLICFPLLIAIVMYCVRVNKVRNAIAYVSAVVIMIAVAVLCTQWYLGGCNPMQLFYETEMIDKMILAGEWILMIVVTYLSFKYKKYPICLLSIAPTLLLTWLDLFSGVELREIHHIYIDRLSILMCVIVGLIGGLIIIYAVGYMHGYHHHHLEYEDRRYYFFMLLFLFLGAMFGFVTSSSVMWLDLFWEITSVCSFLLIGYTKTEEAIDNSFRALWMNLLGGCFLAVGIVILALRFDGDLLLQDMQLFEKTGGGLGMIPVAFFAIAALTKAAQLPFSKWLMGAMVAPTPSSALLHSATMVKAGIYVLFRLAPAMSGNTVGLFISFIGGFTFFMASLMAIAQSDGKKVLAFSTISNLGLMTACAGVGTQETIWAGIFLMIFHAVSKSLLFQDIGAIENATHTRDVEEMNGLIYRLPKLGLFMFIGIAGMFLAPFGMLISKWSALKATVDERNIMLALFICFGSATTLFYWTKWMAKLIAATNKPPVRDITKKNEEISLTIHAILMIALCLFFPMLSKYYVMPLLMEMFGGATQVLPTFILYILIVVIIFIFAVPFIAFLFNSTVKTNQKLTYMNGVNVGDNAYFVDSFGGEKALQTSNWYLKDFFGQRKLIIPSMIAASAVMLVFLGVIIGGAL